jgi:hypothetical protein
MRALFYVCMCATEDEETQQRGFAFVAIARGGHSSGQYRLESARNIPPLVSALPVRIVSIHFCIREMGVVFTPIFNAAIAAFKKNIQVRVRAHHGE